MTPDLRLGAWQGALATVGEVDAVITDPPYSARCHAGHNAAAESTGRKSLDYEAFDEAHIREFVESWAPRCRGWICIFTDSELAPIFREHLLAAGRYVFAPLPCVMPGMTVRLQGDGPSSWAVWLIVARPREAEWAKWGTLPGAYVGPPPSRGSDRAVDSIVRGQKPRWLMEAVVRDYTRPGDLVADPFLGGGTTAIACQATGRRFVGSELDGMTLERARERIARPVQLDLLERREGSE